MSRIYHYEILGSGQHFTAKGRLMSFIVRFILVFKGYNFRYIGSYSAKDFEDRKAHQREIRHKFDTATFNSKAAVMFNRS